MRLIDADELTEMVWRERVDSRERIAELIARQPTIKAPMADVQTVKHGKWDFQGYQLFKCTNCTKIYTQEQLEDIGENWTFPNFCPNCGAKMSNE